MNNSFLVFALVISTLSSFAQSTDFGSFEKKSYPWKDKSLPYRILYPENYSKAIKYPIVVVLHGGGERGNDNEKQLTHGAKLFLDPSVRKTYPAIVIFPQCAADQYWASSTIDRNTQPFTITFDYTKGMNWPLAATASLIRHLVKTESIDKRRIYVTGLSMGGMGTFQMVQAFPKTFAAAAPICGGADLKAYADSKVSTPFMVQHGDADAVVDVNLSRKAVEMLKAKSIKSNKVKVSYIEYKGVNHNSWDNAFANSAYLSWIFSQKRSIVKLPK